MSTDPEYLFLAGLGRSGTTVLRRILGTHPDIALGMERYKGLWNDIGALTPDHFTRARFFDYGDGLTNITPEVPWARDRLRELEAKWDTARYRGDKFTIIAATRLWRRFPDARFVFIVRDVAQVAHSWQVRAANSADRTWPADADAAAAVAAWNLAIQRIHKAVQSRPDHAVVVEYQRVFDDPDGASVRGITDFLGLPFAPLSEVWAGAHRDFRDRVAGRDRTLPDPVRHLIATRADHATWEAVLARAL